MQQSESAGPGQSGARWQPSRQKAFRLVVWYLVVGSVWLLLSDWLTGHLIHNQNDAEIVDVAGDIIYVAGTALMLLLLQARYVREIRCSANLIQDNEARLRLVGDNLPDSFIYQYRRDPDGRPRFTHVSGGVEYVLGVSAGEVLEDASRVLGLIDTAQAPAYLLAEEESARALTDFDMEFRVPRADGTVRLVHARSRPRRNEGGQVVWDGFATEVTERKRLEQDQAASVARYRSLFDNMLNGFAHCRMIFEDNLPVDFIYLDVNPAFRKLTGLSNVVGKRAGEAIPGICTTDPGLIAAYGRVAMTGVPEQFETYVEALKSWLAISVYSPAKEHFVAVFNVVTKRKQAEEALRLSEAKFAHAFANNAAAIGLTTLEDGIMLEVNDTWVGLTGYSREELIGRTARTIWTSPEAAEGFVRELRETGVVRGWEREFRKKCGEIFVGEICAQSMVVDGRDIILSTIVDATARKRAEGALQEREHQLQLFVEHCPAGVAMVDREMRYLAVSRRWLADYQLGDRDIIGLSHYEIFPEIPERWKAGHQKCLAGVADKAEADVFQRADGTAEWLRWEIQPWHTAKGEIGGIIMFSEIITERVRSENALKESERLLQTVINLVPHPIFAKDKESRFIFVNQSCAALNGLTPEQMIGKRIIDFLSSTEEAEAFMRDDREVMESGRQKFVAAETLTDAKGQTRILQTAKVPLHIPGKGPALLGTSVDITELKRTEQALRLSEMKYSLAFSNNPAAIVLTRLNDGTYVEVNDTWVALMGFSRPEAIGQSARKMNIWPDAAAVERFVAELREKGVIHGWELEFRKKSGDIFIAEMSAQVLTIEGEKIVLSTMLDVTARKRAETASRQSEEEFRAMFETASIGMGQADPRTGQFVRVNQKLCEITGYQMHELLQLRVPDITHPDDRGQDWERFQRVIRGELPSYHLEKRYVRKDGNVAWVNVNMTRLVDGAGRAIRTMATIEDITERRKADEERMRWSAALEQAAESIVITDLKGVILYVNPAFEQVTGYSRSEAIGKNSRIFKSGQQNTAFYKQLWDTLKRGEVWHGHFSNKRKDGTVFEEDATISPLRDMTGQIVNYMAIKLDVTREMELQGQFRQAQKLEAIGQLAGGVAHDFNNILTSIMMQVGLCNLAEDLPTEVRQGFDQISRDAERAASLTRQLLLFSRRQVMQACDLDLNDTITNMAKMLQRIIGEDVRLQLHLHSKPLMAHADAGMLDQVVLNLAVNARDAMPEGGRLLISTSEKIVDEELARQQADVVPGRYACLSVADTGCGIPAEVLPRIFEPFFTTKETGKGTGLGLATVFGIVKQHCGWVTVDTKPGHGTIFQVYLPAIHRAVTATTGAAAPRPRGGTETILLAEDEGVVRTSMRNILTGHGYTVLEAANGASALSLWAAHRSETALLLTDMVMPGGMSGQQLARRLRNDNPQLKVVYASGYSPENAGREINLRAGEYFLQKPLNPLELLKTVRKCLDGDPNE